VSGPWLAVICALALGWVAFAYAGYPLALALLARLSPRPPLARRSQEPAALAAPPAVSVIIAVHEGAGEIRAKLENTLGLSYAGSFEVLVASDASTDGTDEIVRSFEPQGVRLVRLAERGGKEAAQGAAISRAAGDVFVFTDVGARVEPGSLDAIVAPFADPTVGAVSSEDVVSESGGEGAYVRYEMALRRLASRATQLVGLSGSLVAVRRALCAPWNPVLASDFRLAFESARAGLRAVVAPGARAAFGTARDARTEWKRKVRTVRRGLAVLSAYRELLHPRAGRVAFSLWGHKLARVTAPGGLAVALLACLALAPSEPWAGFLLAAQGLAYFVGAWVLVRPELGRGLLMRVIGYFVLVNASIAVAWMHHVRGEPSVMWSPTRR
jgi:cellulose synthase/poly-beta-1,6-N-acetylglucosamine synthase-like glycosyltransferase